MSKDKEHIHSRIWHEEPEPDNPFAAATCRCHGYDVYGEVLGKAGWIEYFYVLFKGERPTTPQARTLENLAVAVANPGPRDHSVRAAMNGGVGGSHNAACLMAALGVGAGQLGGAREVALAVDSWMSCGTNQRRWHDRILHPPKDERADVWQPIEHTPGFDPHGASCPTPVQQTLDCLARCSPGDALPWLHRQRPELEKMADAPLAMTGVAAAALYDLEFTSQQAEMVFLLFRLPGAAVHALEQQEFGFRRYPFFRDAISLIDDPGPHNSSENT